MLDFNWKSTVEDVLREHIYDKVIIKSFDGEPLYNGDAFDTIDGMLLSRPVAELDVKHVNGYEWANIRLCQTAWQVDNMPSYAELLETVQQQANELTVAYNESARYERWYEEERDANCKAIEDTEMVISLLRFALRKKADGRKMKLRTVANQVAFALGYGSGFFNE